MMAHQAEGPVEVPVCLHVLSHRGRVDCLQVIAMHFSDPNGDATSCTYHSYSGEESNSYQGKIFKCPCPAIHPALLVCTDFMNYWTTQVTNVMQMQQQDEGPKWAGIFSPCQLPRNEHSDSWELSWSAQVRITDGSNADA